MCVRLDHRSDKAPTQDRSDLPGLRSLSDSAFVDPGHADIGYYAHFYAGGTCHPVGGNSGLCRLCGKITPGLHPKVNPRRKPTPSPTKLPKPSRSHRKGQPKPSEIQLRSPAIAEAKAQEKQQSAETSKTASPVSLEMNLNIENFNNQSDRDIKSLIDEIMILIEEYLRRKGLVWA